MHLPYNVLKDLIYFHDRINNLFEQKLISVYPTMQVNEGATWVPAVDIYETEGQIILTAELPGVDLQNIRIEVADNELVFKGDRPFPKPGRNREGYRRLEGGYGAFERRFPLPSAVDQENIRATLKDGLLKVIVPKVSTGKHTRIVIEDR